MTTHTNTKIAFGDFQTPSKLAEEICQLLYHKNIQPNAILEPTCGQGNLLLAALNVFPSATKAVGLDINAAYLHILQQTLHSRALTEKVQVTHDDFFSVNWSTIFSLLPEPILIIGNPPWVTNAELTTLNSQNLPQKTNFQQFTGLEAITGKSNFDISEWILIHLLEQLKGRQGILAMLCKSSVARRVLTYSWKSQFAIGDASLYLIDAKKFFNVAVDACLLVCDTQSPTGNMHCSVYTSLKPDGCSSAFGFVDNSLVADLTLYQRWRQLRGENTYKWRSGIKHDCAKFMEFSKENGYYCNGFGVSSDLEDNYLYPMLKSSDVAHQDEPIPMRWMLVPQTTIGQDTQTIRRAAPQTWNYLNFYATLLDQRKSAVYKKQARFAMFGVGDYSFTPWKVAISGLYKKLHFALVGPYAERPVVLDDTCCFLPCASEDEARVICDLLRSEVAQQFYTALIFWNAKRPITIDILNQLDLIALAKELGMFEQLKNVTKLPSLIDTQASQLSLFA